MPALPDQVKRVWEPLRHHPTQWGYWTSRARFNMMPAGRRSGKTTLFKRKLVKRALLGTRFDRPQFFAGAPTRQQAKRLFWEDLKLMVPNSYKRGKPSEGELVIRLINGADIHVLGMDVPERIEGQPWDGGGLDEYANMKPETWAAHVRPALSDRLGWCDKFGVPEGRNHYYYEHKAALQEMAELGQNSVWATWAWESADILSADEIAQAMRDLDPITFEQEYRASFINFEGQCYYVFREEKHCKPLKYDPKQPLIFCFDFNVDPGTAAVCQEQRLPNGLDGTGVIGEVHIPRNSNTPAVCRRLKKDWGDHPGRIYCYGDATGGSRGSAKVLGDDWELVIAELQPHFGERLFFEVGRGNPTERARINAVNSRLESADGSIRMMVDPSKAPNVVIDFEGVTLLKGGTGEIDKKKNPQLSHLTDGIGYYIEREFPVIEHTEEMDLVL